MYAIRSYYVDYGFKLIPEHEKIPMIGKDFACSDLDSLRQETINISFDNLGGYLPDNIIIINRNNFV